MKIGFSSLTCPQWDLQTIITKAAEIGFDGVELNGVSGQTRHGLLPELAAKPEETGSLLEEHNVELMCLSTSATLDHIDPTRLAQARAEIVECIELAGKLGCPNVRILPGRMRTLDSPARALSRIAYALQPLIPVATESKVTLLLENGGDYVASDAVWFLVDALNHPAARCCWNQFTALYEGERPTTSIPRLAQKLGAVHLCDGEFDARGALLDYKPLGEGDAEIAKQIELLKGIAYQGYLVIEWPKERVPSLPEPEAALPAAVEFLRARLAEKPAALTAYKGDKKAPRYAALRSPTTLSGV
jgi:sugar phosphate isomerase/epimerase